MERFYLSTTFWKNKKRYAYLELENLGKVRRGLLSILRDFISSVNQIVV